MPGENKEDKTIKYNEKSQDEELLYEPKLYFEKMIESINKKTITDNEEVINDLTDGINKLNDGIKEIENEQKESAAEKEAVAKEAEEKEPAAVDQTKGGGEINNKLTALKTN